MTRAMLKGRGIMVAATGEHAGKTTFCLALMSGLRKRLGPNVGFIKPVGQKQAVVKDSVTGKELKVDKDVKLFKEYFNLDTCRYQDMNPVKIPPGYTRDFLDGGITEQDQVEAIKLGYSNLSKTNEYVVVEGTGHCGVGTIVNLDNAQGARILGTDIILIVSGGLGSAFDELAMNRMLCQQNGVKIRGVILNKVKPEKIDMIREYFTKALKRHNWEFPVLGVVPEFDYLGLCTMLDYEILFGNNLISETNSASALWHFDSMELVAMDLDKFCERFSFNSKTAPKTLKNKTLYITHASRSDVILGFLAQKKMISEMLQSHSNLRWNAALLLTGRKSVPTPGLMKAIQEQDQPVLMSGMTTFDTLNALNNYTAKLNEKDVTRTRSAIKHYEDHINFDLILQ